MALVFLGGYHQAIRETPFRAADTIHTTSPTLLEGLRQAGNTTAWSRFVDLYTPILYAWARRCGETEDDAADLVQEVFVALVQFLPTFQSQPGGKFRGWLRTILLNKLRDRKRRETRRDRIEAQRPAEEALPDHAEQFWEAEYQREVAQRALALMQTEFTASTWQACWETVVRGRSPADVACELGLTENAVYLARSRVLRRLRQELRGLVD
jgi:RNA polymerase sigma-70 factor (ECF subfamily)